MGERVVKERIREKQKEERLVTRRWCFWAFEVERRREKLLQRILEEEGQSCTVVLRKGGYE